MEISVATSHIEASTWRPDADMSASERSNSRGWPVVLIGIGAALNVGWIGLVAFAAARLIIF